MEARLMQYTIVERHLGTREESVPRMICRCIGGLTIAICGTCGQGENLEKVRITQLLFVLTLPAGAGQRARTSGIDRWVPWDRAVGVEPIRIEASARGERRSVQRRGEKGRRRERA